MPNQLVVRCNPNGDCAHVNGLLVSVTRVAEGIPATEITPALLDACAAVVDRATELRRLHLIAWGIDGAPAEA